MANYFTVVTVLMLLSGPAFGTRTTMFNVKTQDGSDGICQSVVVTQGYTCQEHHVTTQDGYILSIQRIPAGRSRDSSSADNNRPTIVLQHGLLMDGMTWLMLPPNEGGLAFVLADNGFDVWIINGRGTKYSRTHQSLSPDNSAYWDWSWDELATYELPATIKYVYDQTGRKKLHYVGHSQGTLTVLAAISNGELVSMLRSLTLLSPIAYVGQMTSPLATIAAHHFIAEGLQKFGVYEFNLKAEAVTNMLRKICSIPGVNCADLFTSFAVLTCLGSSNIFYKHGQAHHAQVGTYLSEMIYLITPFDMNDVCKQCKHCCLNSSIVDMFLDHELQPTSIKNMVHLSQMVREGTIAKYNYNNEAANKNHYGQSTPPFYDMKSIPKELPIFITYGGTDALSDVNDVLQLIDDLKGNKKVAIKYIDNYAHGDFVMGFNAKQLLYDPLLAFLKLH